MQIEDTSAGSVAGTLTAKDIVTLASQLHGRMVLPGDTDFAEARRVHFTSEAIPAMIVRAATTSDVAATVWFARERQLEMAVRSGGHSIARYSTVGGGVVLDLALMKTLEFDTQTRMARLGPGLMWGEVAAGLASAQPGTLLR